MYTTMNNLDKENKYIRAKERVEKLKKFYGKLGTYLFFTAFLAGINYYTNQWRNMWFLWVAVFWGISILIEAGKTFGIAAMLGNNWEERKIKEMLEKEEKQEQEQERGSNRWE